MLSVAAFEISRHIALQPSNIIQKFWRERKREGEVETVEENHPKKKDWKKPHQTTKRYLELLTD